ncbi:F-box domain protein [Taphrina deformans PYCC 5710]|uniref:F-box domain protein n=1 Tax=Taphrina deformans (strain PYCC 5710 / ATCC 11124 / CBS 356.35 / IMI 108563 / JCM 9778 / NBRC 8474) TaxID=1097556 RepID=R4XCA0_TAPDE|nr:F-box domain protein [Taphrina deformans PYCC 5710]|eukprot:CCG83200.1 F-box domain protein [Taphrina deformans PYCC 5710]
MNSIKDQARAAITSRDYHAAGRLLDKAIGISMASPDIALYDMRAAVYEKLGQLSDALADSKQILQIDPKDARGYLRAGKIYQLLNKDKSALECYRRGCKMVPTTVSLYKILKQLLKAVDTRINAKVVRLDPFSVLPMELIREVVSYLSFPQKLCCLGVSRSWKALLTADSRFYGRLDLISDCRRRPKIAVVEAYIKKAKGRLEYLMTDVNLKTESLRFHLKFAKDLTILCIPYRRSLLPDLHKARGLKRLTLTYEDDLGPAPSYHQAMHLIRRFSVLTHFKSMTIGDVEADAHATLCNPEMSSLRVLELEADIVIHAKELFMWQDKPALVNLDTLKLVAIERHITAGLLVNTPDIWPKKIRSVRGKIFQPINSATMSIPSSIEEYDLDMLVPRQYYRPILSQAVKLVTVRYYDGELGHSDWQDMLSNAKAFSLLESSSPEQYREIMSRCNNLEVFIVSSSYESKVNDQDLLSFVKRNPNLRTLNLTNFKQITGVGLAKAVQDSPHLDELIIDGCDQIDLEVVKWIRGKMVRLRQKLPK